MAFLIPDDLSIPEFLKREPAGPLSLTVVRRRRAAAIPYPRDGYACKGMRKEARERHRARLRRRAERMREYRPRKPRRNDLWVSAKLMHDMRAKGDVVAIEMKPTDECVAELHNTLKTALGD